MKHEAKVFLAVIALIVGGCTSDIPRWDPYNDTNVTAGSCPGYVTASYPTKFEEVVRAQIINRDWEGLADNLDYPLYVADRGIHSKEDFLKFNWNDVFSDSFFEAIEKNEENQVFSRLGLPIANGRIWIIEDYDRENDKYEFKIKLINDNVAPRRTN